VVSVRRIVMEILPTFGCKPSSGFTMGATSNLAKYLGDPATTRRGSARARAPESVEGALDGRAG
jgi:hypothetical protein